MDEEVNRKIEDVVESVQEHMRSLLSLYTPPAPQEVFPSIQKAYEEDEKMTSAKTADDLEEKVGQLEINIKYYLETIANLTHENKALCEDNDKLRKALASLREEHKVAECQVSALKKELEENQSMANFKAAKLEEITYKTIEELKTIYEAENNKLKAKLQGNNFESLSGEIKESLVSLATELKNYISALSSTKDSSYIKQVLSHFDKFQGDISKIVKMISQFHGVIQKLESAKQTLKKRLKEKDEEVDKLKLNIRVRTSQLHKSQDFQIIDKQTESLVQKDCEIAELKKQIGDLRLEKSMSQSKPPSSPKHLRHSSHLENSFSIGTVTKEQQIEKMKREINAAAIKIGKMRITRDKAVLDYDLLLQQLKQAKFALASFQEQAAAKEFKASTQIKDLICVIQRLGEEKNISLRAKVMVEKVLSCRRSKRSARSCGVSPKRF